MDLCEDSNNHLIFYRIHAEKPPWVAPALRRHGFLYYPPVRLGRNDNRPISLRCLRMASGKASQSRGKLIFRLNNI